MEMRGLTDDAAPVPDDWIDDDEEPDGGDEFEEDRDVEDVDPVDMIDVVQDDEDPVVFFDPDDYTELD